MIKRSLQSLSRRERQIMDIIFQKGRATAGEVNELLPDPPSNSSVRTLLRVLENKGYLKHTVRGQTYVYSATMSHGQAKQSSLAHLKKTFFGGSNERVVAALLDLSGSKLTEEELNRISDIIEKAKKEGK